MKGPLSLHQGLKQPWTLGSRQLLDPIPSRYPWMTVPPPNLHRDTYLKIFNGLSIHLLYIFNTFLIITQYMLSSKQHLRLHSKISPQFHCRETCHFKCASRTE